MYAIPALVGGLALKYAELPPVPLDTSPAAEAAREAKATTIQKKVLSDATRFTYGDAHMEDPLKALKLAPRGMGPPNLVALGEEVASTGGYALKMRFQSPNTPYRVWKDRAPRYSRFFGPNVRAELKLVRFAQRDAPVGKRRKGERVGVRLRMPRLRVRGVLWALRACTVTRWYIALRRRGQRTCPAHACR